MIERWRTSRPSSAHARALPRRAALLPASNTLHGAVAATWLGHSTVLLQFADVTVLTDPVWAHRVSPVSFAGPVRWVPPMLALADLPRIDFVLQSHNHYDHFDRAATRELAHRNPRATWCVPLGMAPAVRRCGVGDVREFDWWNGAALRVLTAHGEEMVRVDAVPAQHFSGRGLADRDRSLWCGWTVAANGARVYFAGDSGYHPQFGEIAQRCGPFDLMILPIGAYEPRWFMSRVHMNPGEAVAAWRTMSDVQREHHGLPPSPLLGVHWGTYRLTDEPMDEPPVRTREHWQNAGLPDGLLWLLAHGETRRLSIPAPASLPVASARDR